MSPSCMVKSKESVHQPKSKSFKNSQKPKIKDSMTTKEMKEANDETVYIELDLKCCCPQSKLNNNASIQFSRRYLQCQSSMPIAILRSYIQHILPHSSMTQVTFYDSHHRLLHDDQQLLSSLQSTIVSSSTSSSSSSSSSSSYIHIPIRFSLLNTITSLTHCSCSSSSSSPSPSTSSSSSSSLPTIIKRETIDRTLSTCSSPSRPTATATSTSPIIYSPCLSSSSSSSSSPTQSPPLSTSISIVNLLTPPPSSSSPSCHSSTMNEKTAIDSTSVIMTDRNIIDEITSQFGEICPPIRKKNRNGVSKKSMISSNIPLDLSLKKRPLSSSCDMFSSQPKWIKT